MSIPDKPTFNKAQHIKYWLRCLKTYLPNQYTSNDSQRTTLGFFILSALDLLGVLHERTTDSERAAYVDWIYRCQLPDGGFRGFTGTDLGEARDDKNSCWDPANLAATYSSLAALMVLGDGLGRVKWRECLRWIKRLQLEDGSFGEALGEGGEVAGGKDMRFCYCATAVRWMLRVGKENEEDDIEDIDVEALLRFITSSQSYEGGIAQRPFIEAHAGLTYCGIGAISLLGRLPQPKGKRGSSTDGNPRIGPEFVDDVTRWLVYRQTSSQEEGFSVREDDFPSPLTNYRTLSRDASTAGAKTDPIPVFQVRDGVLGPPENIHPVPPIISQTTPLPPEHSLNELQYAGFSGRCNKVSDTCYSFWVGGALAILHQVHLLNFTANRNYLLSKAQHLIGGFGKYPGDPPDILHSYLGLAALAAMREQDLRSLDPMLCITVSAREGLENSVAAGAAARGKGGVAGGG